LQIQKVVIAGGDFKATGDFGNSNEIVSLLLDDEEFHSRSKKKMMKKKNRADFIFYFFLTNFFSLILSEATATGEEATRGSQKAEVEGFRIAAERGEKTTRER
jgi:hypothetical protein